MHRVKHGDLVRVSFTGRLLDGRVFHSPATHGVVELRVGDQTVPPGLTAMLIGMRPGESRSALVPASQAFGPRRDDLLLHVDAASIPPAATPQVGDLLELHNDRGQRMHARVVAVSADEITLDANHPLAGHDVQIELDLLGIGPPAAPS